MVVHVIQETEADAIQTKINSIGTGVMVGTTRYPLCACRPIPMANPFVCIIIPLIPEWTNCLMIPSPFNLDPSCIVLQPCETHGSNCKR
jgi:hypothetical protein